MLDTEQLVLFHALPSMTPRILRSLLQHDVAPKDQADWQQLGADEQRAAQLVSQWQEVDTNNILERFRGSGARLLRFVDPDYPVSLKTIHSAPPILYVRGSVSVLQQSALAVVGTRQPTAYGLEATRRLVGPVAAAGIPIVSGLAYGIDALAHQLAVEHHASTIAVIGTGIDSIYPASHRDLAEKIIEGGGAIVSEFPIGAKPERHHFPQRNRIISGLAKAVLLVEAGEKSGALITAKFAVDQNREVLAVPGNITSAQSVGVLNWIKLGATPVTTANDILSLFSRQQGAFPLVTTAPLPADPIEAQLVLELRSGPRHVDVLAEACRLDTSVVSAALSLLELRDLVRHDGGMIYRLNA